MVGLQPRHRERAMRSSNSSDTLRRAAESGDPEAQDNRGLCFARGDSVPQSYEEAIKAKIVSLLSAVVLSGCLCTNPDKSQRTVGEWIPPGTPQEHAIRIMKQHGFESGICGSKWSLPKGETVYCFWHETKVLKNSRSFFVRFKDGKVVSISGPVTGNNFFDFIERYDSSGA